MYGNRPVIFGLLSLLLLSAGCLTQPTFPEDVPSPGIALPVAFDHPCGPGRDEMRTAEVCVGTFYDPLRPASDPLIAVHPKDPSTWVLAVNHLPGPALHLSSGARVHVAEGVLYRTLDAGTSWQRLPTPEGPSRTVDWNFQGSPISALGLSEDGRLHVIWLVNGQQGREVVYTSTPDEGRSWEHTHQLARGQGFVVGGMAIQGSTIGVSFGDLDATHVAWSYTGGVSWKNMVFGPRFGSPTIWNEEVCVPIGSEVVCLDQEGVAQRSVTTRNSGGPLRLFVQANNTLLAVGPLADVFRFTDRHFHVMASSTEDGMKWTKSISLINTSKIVYEWRVELLDRAIMLDRNGLVHILLSDNLKKASGPVSSGGNINEGREHRIAHLVADPATGELLYEVRLTPTDWQDRPFPPGLFYDREQTYSGGWYALAPYGDGVVLAWPFYSSIDYAVSSPVWS